jgi:hypothetical protein
MLSGLVADYHFNLIICHLGGQRKIFIYPKKEYICYTQIIYF